MNEQVSQHQQDQEPTDVTATRALADEDVLVLQDAPVELELAVWEPTGDEVVDGALEQLSALGELDLADHAQVFSAVHEQLRSRLTDVSAPN